MLLALTPESESQPEAMNLQHHESKKLKELWSYLYKLFTVCGSYKKEQVKDLEAEKNALSVCSSIYCHYSIFVFALCQ